MAAAPKKKAASKKTAAKKQSAGKAVKKKTTAKKTAAGKAAAKKATQKKTAARKTAAKKATQKKTATRKTAAKKAAQKKTAAGKKTTARKPVAKKAPAKKTAAEKAPAEITAAVKAQEAEPAAETAPQAAAPAKAAKKSWHPNIVVFACNWCSYAGADTAGVSRIQHQPHFRTIRVMCSGRIHPGFVMRAFEKGADGVLVSGCHIGDCHYVSGNERQLEHFEITKQLVHLIGLEPGRVRLEWISAAEGPRWAAIINEFTDQIRNLGPSPLNNGSKAG